MNFLKKLFGKQHNNSLPGNDPMPSRHLNFQFEITPDNGNILAQQFVDAVQKNDNINLTYSIDSIAFVEEFLENFKREGITVNDFAETIFVAGAYVGEIMVKNSGGVWIWQEEAIPPDGIKMMPIIVKLPNGNYADPIAKAFKRFHYGETESIQYFYEVFTNNQT